MLHITNQPSSGSTMQPRYSLSYRRFIAFYLSEPPITKKAYYQTKLLFEWWTAKTKALLLLGPLVLLLTLSLILLHLECPTPALAEWQPQDHVIPSCIH